MAKNEYTVKLFVRKENGEDIPLEKLTKEERAQWEANMRARLSAWGNQYFANHPDQYERL